MSIVNFQLPTGDGCGGLSGSQGASHSSRNFLSASYGNCGGEKIPYQGGGSGTNGKNAFFRTFNDGLSFPAGHTDGCEDLGVGECLVLTSDVDEPFLVQPHKIIYLRMVISFMAISMGMVI